MSETAAKLECTGAFTGWKSIIGWFQIINEREGRQIGGCGCIFYLKIAQWSVDHKIFSTYTFTKCQHFYVTKNFRWIYFVPYAFGIEGLSNFQDFRGSRGWGTDCDVFSRISAIPGDGPQIVSFCSGFQCPPTNLYRISVSTHKFV